MKKIMTLLVLVSVTSALMAQKEGDDASTKGFKKENLFSGGSLTVSFSNYTTVLGGSPVLGYSLTKWLDAGILFNYTYASNRHVTYYNSSTGQYFSSDDKLKQTTWGPGAFLRIYPVPFLFLQAQGEENFTSQKLIPANGGPTEKDKVSAGSLLVGAGYCNGREGPGMVFYYVSIMADVAKNKNSPYTEQLSNGKVNILPIIRAGLQIPLFQGGRGRH